MKKIILIVSILLIVCGITPVFANQDETIVVNGKTYSLIEETESKSQNKVEEQSDYINEEDTEYIITGKNNTKVEFKISDNDSSVHKKSDNVLDSIFKSKTKTTLFIVVCFIAVFIFFSTFASTNVGYAIFTSAIFLVVMIPIIYMSIHEIISFIIMMPCIPVFIILIIIMHLDTIDILNCSSDFIREEVPLIAIAAVLINLVVYVFILL